MLCYYLSILTVCLIHMKSANGWDIPSNNQYHIQTDEGPERYFRYQTDSGQYRKEKRLEDGTVVGTYAWIDDNGILRQRDYIADIDGYRILNTKNIYVGRNIPVGRAIKAAKKYLVTTGDLMKNNQKPLKSTPFKTNFLSGSYPPGTLQYTTLSPTTSTSAMPYEEISSNNIISTTSLGILTSTESPVVNIMRNSVYSTPTRPLLPNSSTINEYNTGPYISTYSSIGYTKKLTPYYQSKPSSFTGYTRTSSTVNSQKVPSTHTIYEPIQALNNDYNKISPKENQKDLSYNHHLQTIYNKFQNGPTYPVDQNDNIYIGQNIENEKNPQFKTYDGISITNDGFRYYIPRAYHEEQTLSVDKKTGSFGYIDPFGIRRVIYYNTSPENGFQYKKNNRYVGFQATPYDPRP